MEYIKSPVKVDWNCDFKDMWYIPCGDNGMFYLHKDGIVRSSTQDMSTREYKGYFDTLEDAENAIKEYKKHRLATH